MRRQDIHKEMNDEKVMRKYDELCSKAFTRRAGGRVRVKLVPFPITNDITKSVIFGVRVGVEYSETSVPIPSILVVKRYIPGMVRTSEVRDTTYEEFMKEKVILDLDIHLKNESGDRIRIYPELYSKDVPECDKEMIILREYLNEKNLRQIAMEQKQKDGIKWETTIGTTSISDSLRPIALTHVHSPIIAEALKERELLSFGTPEEADPNAISLDRAKRFVRYIRILVRGSGKELNEKDTSELEKAFFELDANFVSRKEFLGIVDGELDVFPHHGMLERIPDAGGVEVGGFVRDLAVYSAPDFRSLWNNLEDMPQTVRKKYLPLRRNLEESLMYKSKELNIDLLDFGTLFASVNGNIRKAAADVHYRGDSDRDFVEKEATLYLNNGYQYLDTFIRVVDKEKYKQNANTIRNVLDTYQLRTDRYTLTRPFNGYKKRWPTSRRDFMFGKGHTNPNHQNNIPPSNKKLKISKLYSKFQKNLS